VQNELNKRVNNLEERVEQIQENIQIDSKDISTSNNLYKCTHCFATFSRTDNLNRHLTQKRCRGRNDNVEIYEKELGISTPDIKPLTCRFCNVTFSKQQSYSRHKTRGCSDKKDYECELKNQVLANRREAAASISNVTNNNCGNKIIINLPPMNSFDDTMKNIDYMTTKLLLKELEKHRSLNKNDLTGIIDTYTKLMHANPAHPENQNVLFKSLNSGFARVYNGREFEDRQSIEVQDTIVQNVGQKIGEVCSEYDNEQGEISDILDQIDVNFGNKLAEIKEGNYTRGLSQCRNTVKAALHSKKDEIELAHQLIENHQE